MAALGTGAVILLCAAPLFGCVSGPDQRHAYHLANPPVRQRGSGVLALAVQDQRPYVLSGAKRSTFTGVSRGRVGNPFDVTTVSGQSLAADFTASIRGGLERAGYRVRTPAVGDQTPLAEVGIALSTTGAPRGLVVRIQDWWTDTYNGTALHYGLVMAVFDATGSEIARTLITGDDTLVPGGQIMDAAARAKKAVADAYGRKLEKLLNAAAISRALGPTTVAPAEAPAGPPAAVP